MTTLLLRPVYFFRTIFHHLWLSISSVDFYVRVFKNYRGYGFKYIFTLSMMSAFLCTAIFLHYSNKIQNYFEGEMISAAYIENMDHVLQQIPEMDYDGERITIPDETPSFLYSIDNRKVVALDPENKLKPSDRGQIPVIFTSEKMVIHFLNEDDRPYYTAPIEYSKIFGQHPQLLTQEVLKTSVALAFSKTPWVFIYMLFPILTALIFTNLLFEKIFIIFVVYFMARLSGVGASLQTSVRMVMFASGTFVLLQFIILLAFPFFKSSLWMVQIWSNFLMILGIVKVSRNTRRRRVFK